MRTFALPAHPGTPVPTTDHGQPQVTSVGEDCGAASGGAGIGRVPRAIAGRLTWIGAATSVLDGEGGDASELR